MGSKEYNVGLKNFPEIFFDLKRPAFVLFATRNGVSPLGPREVLVNVDKASPGLLVIIWGIESFGDESLKMDKF